MHPQFFPVAKKKLFRFNEIKSYANVLEYPPNMQGNWNKFFGNSGKIVLELACGRGEYTVGLSRLHPGENIIGVDIKGNRMYIGAKTALEEGLKNAAFLRTQIEMLPDYFAPGEVNNIWITFPDPQLRKSRAKKRLTHPRFLRLYRKILAPKGVINLKTDSPVLYRFTQKVIEMYNCTLLAASENIYSDGEPSPELRITTHYEKLDIAGSRRIHFLSFALPPELPDRDEELKQWVNEFE